MIVTKKSNLNRNKGKGIEYIISFILLTIYLLFPTHNSTLDAYNYAVEIKWNRDLFSPHHLLYNPFGYILYHFLHLIGWHIATLPLMKIVNAVFAGLSLITLSKILNLLTTNVSKITSLLFLTGSSFAVMRFATENETYIIPIFFSLIANFYLTKYLCNQQKNYYIVLSGFFGATACLFHQIHFFWWLGILVSYLLFVKKNKIEVLVYYISSAIIVPLAYLAVIKFYMHQNIKIENFIHFLFHDYYTGAVHTNVTSLNFILTIISLIRTFFQVHGSTFFILKKGGFYILPAIISLIGLAFSIYYFSRVKRSSLFTINYPFVFFSQLIIVTLQFCFAFYSVGNSEFMVMIPFLISIILVCFINLKTKAILAISIALFIWNFSYGIFPNYSYDYNGNKKLINYIKKYPGYYFILQNKENIECELFYQDRNRPSNLWPHPSHFALMNTTPDTLIGLITNAKQKGQIIITDCYNNETGFDRRNFIAGNANYLFFKSYNLVPWDSIETFYGMNKLYRIN